jgi:hypothetical protein
MSSLSFNGAIIDFHVVGRPKLVLVFGGVTLLKAWLKTEMSSRCLYSVVDC